jgi:hypothetical protein
LHLRSLTSPQAAFGGQSNGRSSVVVFVAVVAFVHFVVKTRFVSVAFLRVKPLPPQSPLTPVLAGRDDLANQPFDVAPGWKADLKVALYLKRRSRRVNGS